MASKKNATCAYFAKHKRLAAIPIPLTKVLLKQLPGKPIRDNGVLLYYGATIRACPPIHAHKNRLCQHQRCIEEKQLCLLSFRANGESVSLKTPPLALTVEGGETVHYPAHRC